MASKVLVPAAPFTKLQLKKSPSEPSGSGFVISGGDAVARVAHLEHSVRFLQEQHRLMLSGLHAEIEALRERNRDLQFQLIFNKESPKTSSPPVEEPTESNEEANLKRDVARLEREAGAARGEARAAEARALQLQRLVDAQAEKLRELELARPAAPPPGEPEESRGELRARLADAERLVRRLRADAERQRRELQCMKNSLHASLRASGLEGGYGYQNNYFPALHEFWREPLREEFSAAPAPALGGAGPAATRTRARRPLTLPELAGNHMSRSIIYANNHTREPRPRAACEHKCRNAPPADAGNVTTTDENAVRDHPRLVALPAIPRLPTQPILDPLATYPELKIVVTRMIPHGNVKNGQAGEAGSRTRPRRHHHRKHAPDHT